MKHKIENGNVLVLERVFDRSRDRVFRMFKDPALLAHWWGPKGWELPVCNIDFRPGGVWHFCMKCTDKNQGTFHGMESWGKVVFHEIEEPQKIVYNDYFSDAEGNENPELPSTRVTTTFVELEKAKTKLISRGEYASKQALDTVMGMGLLDGVTQTWDRLEELLAKSK